MKKAGLNQSQIADEVGIDKSTISREFGRILPACAGMQIENQP
ncbi:MAG: helix-turn-helix domain-containing protein [Proteobacteria bacterium]|nr:helix-turn-helix domain-containing protein [Pseudomonadota bacterium]